MLLFDVPEYGDLYAHNVEELWESLRGRKEDPPSEWIEGFQEGASEVWDEVANKI